MAGSSWLVEMGWQSISSKYAGTQVWSKRELTFSYSFVVTNSCNSCVFNLQDPQNPWQRVAVQVLRPCGFVYCNCCPFEICLCHWGFLMLHRKLEARLLRFGHAGPEQWRNREWSWGLQKLKENSSLWYWDSSPYWWRKELCVPVSLWSTVQQIPKTCNVC